MQLIDLVKSFSIYEKLEKEINNNVIQNCYILYSNDVEILNSFSMLLSKLLVENNGYVLKNNPELELNIKTYSENEQMNVDIAQEIIKNSVMPPKLPKSNKVFILDFVNIPTVIVQNKLLKTIEEPEYGAKYIIKTTNYYSILDTIKSRSRLINIKSINKEELLKFFTKQGLSSDEFNKIYSVCPEFSDFMKVLNKEDLTRMELRELVIYTLNNLKMNKFQNLLSKLQKALYNKVDIYLDVFMLYTKDIIESRLQNKNSLSNIEIEVDYPTKFYLKIQDSIIKALTNYRFNQNNDFIVRNFLLEILEDSVRCKKL